MLLRQAEKLYCASDRCCLDLGVSTIVRSTEIFHSAPPPPLIFFILITKMHLPKREYCCNIISHPPKVQVEGKPILFFKKKLVLRLCCEDVAVFAAELLKEGMIWEYLFLTFHSFFVTITPGFKCAT